MIPFNRPALTGKEIENLHQVLENRHLSGDGPFTHRCRSLLERETGCNRVLLTHSCTAALEMAALILDLGPGDEVIMPSYTFVSTANAFVLRGATPVFVDIKPDTLNLDESLIQEAISPRTKAIVPVHYAGVSCEMDAIMTIARRHDLMVVEDAAQGVSAFYKDRALGSLGHLGTLSFHESKNLISGEGGALLISEEGFVARAEILREKGTNRNAFFRGEIDKYTWMDLGSSFLPSELVAAFLYAQLEGTEDLTRRRLAIWDTYHRAFEELEEDRLVRRPVIPPECRHNGHMYYLLFPDLEVREYVIKALKDVGIGAVFHYVPLHSSPGGRRFGRPDGDLPVTDAAGSQLLRLPLWVGIEPHVEYVIQEVIRIVRDQPQPKRIPADSPFFPGRRPLHLEGG